MNSIINAFFLKSIRPYFSFPGLSLPGALNSGLWLDEKIDALQHNISVEVADYLERYPQTKHVDVYLNDINGIMRGKRLSVESMLNLEKGCYFPLSVYSMDQKGKIAALLNDEPDRLCIPVRFPAPLSTRSAPQRADPADDERQRRRPLPA